MARLDTAQVQSLLVGCYDSLSKFLQTTKSISEHLPVNHSVTKESFRVKLSGTESAKGENERALTKDLTDLQSPN